MRFITLIIFSSLIISCNDSNHDNENHALSERIDLGEIENDDIITEKYYMETKQILRNYDLVSLKVIIHSVRFW